MDSCMKPPNYQALSDRVIRIVLESRHRPRTPHLIHCSQLPRYGIPVVVRAASGSQHLKSLHQPLRRPQTTQAESDGSGHVSTTKPNNSQLRKGDLLALERKIRHRERCRINQLRYREKQSQRLKHLEEAINKLRSDIHILKTQSCDPRNFPNHLTMWTAAAEYFRHFNNYVSAPGTMHDTAMDFLRQTMSVDVSDGPVTGVEGVFEHWRFLAIHFEDVRLELQGVKSFTGNPQKLVASTVTKFTITLDTLRHVFSHLNSDGKGGADGGSWSQHAVKLLGQRLVMPSTICFNWDSTHNNISTMESSTDILNPLLQVLGDLQHVSDVFEKARLTLDCRFVKREG